MAEIIEKENIAATLAREARKPFELNPEQNAVPDGWTIQDTEAIQLYPRRKKATIACGDQTSFVDYVKRQGSLANCTIWCNANYPQGKVDYLAIINDHGEEADAQQWRDHQAKFCPENSIEWQRWISAHGQKMEQFQFAEFIENNLADIASAEGYPTGTAMLQMATALEITQDCRIKSAIRLQSGGVRMEYVQDDNAATAESMQVFSKFALGLPVFRSGDAYQLEARLKYKLASGKLTFWYEINRADKVLEAAAKTLTQSIQEASGFPLFHGNPFS